MSTLDDVRKAHSKAWLMREKKQVKGIQEFFRCLKAWKTGMRVIVVITVYLYIYPFFGRAWVEKGLFSGKRARHLVRAETVNRMDSYICNVIILL